MNLKKYVAMGIGAIMAMGITLSSFSAVSADNSVAPRSAVMTTASHYDDYEGVITSNVNLRAKASSKSTKVGYLKKGTVVEIERKASNGWYKIEYRHMEGYISPKYVTVYNDEYREIDKKGTTTAQVTVRAGASTKATKRGTLAKGTRVEVESKTSNGWYKIEYRGGEGYVSSKYIKLGTTGGYTYRELDDYDGIATAGVNVRAGASTSSTKLGHLSKGARVEVEGKTSNGWYKIEYRDRDAYVSAKYIKLVADWD